MVNNHGDRYRPLAGVIPFANGLFGLNGVILQVPQPQPGFQAFGQKTCFVFLFPNSWRSPAVESLKKNQVFPKKTIIYRSREFLNHPKFLGTNFWLILDFSGNGF